MKKNISSNCIQHVERSGFKTENFSSNHIIMIIMEFDRIFQTCSSCFEKVYYLEKILFWRKYLDKDTER